MGCSSRRCRSGPMSSVCTWSRPCRLSTGGAHQETTALRQLIGMRVGGLLIASGVVRTEDLQQFLPTVPVVSVGRPEEHPGVYGVSYDERDNATQIAHAVYDHGHRRIAVLVPRSD